MLIQRVDLKGFCCVCGCKVHGRVHNCPGEIRANPKKEIMGAQWLDEMTPAYDKQRQFGTRLEDGFAMMFGKYLED